MSSRATVQQMIRALPVPLVASVLMLASGCGSAPHTSTRVAPNPKGHRVVVEPAVRSPGGGQVAQVEHVLSRKGSIGFVHVGPNGRTTRTVYSSNEACCSNVRWVSRRIIIFDDDYRVKTVDVVTGRVQTIATFSNFTVSSNGRWVAGWALGGHSAEQIGVVSISGGSCRVVPKPANADDTEPRFSADSSRLTFQRRRFDGHDDEPGTLHLVTVSMSSLRPPPIGGGC